MSILRVIFHAFFLYNQSLGCIGCDTKFIKEPLNGHFCTSTSNNAITLWQTDRPRCILSCTGSKTCRYINHNAHIGQCVLGLEQCEILVPMFGGTLTVFGPPRDTCLHWGSKNEPGRVPVNEKIHQHIRTGRVLTNGALVVGKVDPSGIFYANDHGTEISERNNIEFLTKDPTCTVLWMPYTTDETLPIGAVSGGRLSDGSITYVCKLSHLICYYDEGTQQAYYANSGAHTTTTMEILVLV